MPSKAVPGPRAWLVARVIQPAYYGGFTLEWTRFTGHRADQLGENGLSSGADCGRFAPPFKVLLIFQDYDATVYQPSSCTFSQTQFEQAFRGGNGRAMRRAS
jgi:hypothetical protein